MGVPAHGGPAHTYAPPPAPSARAHAQHLPHRTWRRAWSAETLEQVARATPVMAEPALAAGGGPLEPCGLERILEALRLLLSPGGERADHGAGLHWGLARPL